MPCLATHSHRAGQDGGQLEAAPVLGIFINSLLLSYYVCVTSFTSYSSVSSWCMGSCSFPQRESWQNTCPSCCLLILLTSTLTTPSSHFLTYTEMEISWLLSFAWFFFTCTSCFQLLLYYSWLLLLTFFAPNSSLPKTDHCVCLSLQPLLPFSHSCIISLAVLCAGPHTSLFGCCVFLNLLSVKIIKIFLNRVGHINSRSVLWWLHLHIATLPYPFKLVWKTSLPCHFIVTVDPPAWAANIHRITMEASLWFPLLSCLQIDLDSGLIVGVLKSLSSVVNNIFSYLLYTPPYLKLVVRGQGW